MKEDLDDAPYLSPFGELTEKARQLAADKRLAREAEVRRQRQKAAEDRAAEAERQALITAAKLKECETRLARLAEEALLGRLQRGLPK
jgi:hypothetical protein